MANRLKAGLAAGACLVSVLATGVGALAIAARAAAVEPVALEQVLEAFDQGTYVEARNLAKRLEKQGALAMEDLGVPAFVLGASVALEADDTWSKDKTQRYLLASRYLEQARDLGFPVGRRAEGLFLLGKSLYFSGQIPASRLALLDALKVDKNRKTEIHRLLAGAYLNDANPKLQEALQQNTLYMADRSLPIRLRHDGLLQRARILLQMERVAECLATLDKIPSDAGNRAEAIVIRGRVLMHEARTLKDKPDATAEDQRRAEEKYRAALKSLKSAQSRDTLSTQASSKAMYLTGLCYLEMGGQFTRAALDQFALTQKMYADTPEGLAAGLQEAELYRQLLGRSADALAAYRRTLSAVTDPENFSNPWITLDELRSRMSQAYQYYLQTQRFEISLQLTRHFFPLFSRTRTLAMTAEVHQTWGRFLMDQADQEPPNKAQPLRHQGRIQFQQAGHVYLRLAKLLTTTRRYPDQLWNSASAYFTGQNYRSAARVLSDYLQNESRRRRPQALVRLGEARLALDEVDEALEDFRQCVEFFPRDAASFRARLLAARAYLEKGETQQAEGMLQENLNGEGMTPASKEWRNSLFALGELYHVQHRFQDAILSLEQAVTRYPEDPQALQARYLVADSYRQAASEAQEKLRNDLIGSTQITHTQKIQEGFQQALEGYQEIQQMLGRRQETRALLPLEQSILRNCYFSVGDIHFDLEQYDAAIAS